MPPRQREWAGYLGAAGKQEEGADMSHMVFIYNKPKEERAQQPTSQGPPGP